MSSPYDRYDRGPSRRRGIWGHWVPLVLTVTVATVGLAAWAWSQRSEEEDEDSAAEEAHHLDYENADYGENPPYGSSSRQVAKPPPSFTTDPRLGESAHGTIQVQDEASTTSWGAKMSGALRRTPSPNQFIGNAGRTMAAGMAAAGAAVGSALASIREDDRSAYADHETWSEEADAKAVAKKSRTKDPNNKQSHRKRKSVAIVVSADAAVDDLEGDGFLEHASILSHIPRQIDFGRIKLYILIYAPSLKEASLEAPGQVAPASLSSSYTNIEHDQAQSPKEEQKSPLLTSSAGNPAFNAIYSEALTLVDRERHIIPFTSPNSHAHILRQLQPEVVYLQESLSGDNGSAVTQLQTWFRHDVILVVGAESGSGGLADSESEAEKPGQLQKAERWWQRRDRVGRGRGVVVVDGMRVNDDWARRVQGEE